MRRIFIISRQKCGTTSTAGFFRHHGFKVCEADGRYSKLWSLYHYSGRHELIFNSARFGAHQVFEDEPWWRNGVFEVLVDRFPDAFFVLIKRDPVAWFDSLVKHRLRKKYFRGFDALEYGLEAEFAEYLDSNREKIDCDLFAPSNATKEKYLSVYHAYHLKISELVTQLGIDNQFFQGEIEDPLLWMKLGAFFDVTVRDGFSIHENKAV